LDVRDIGSGVYEPSGMITDNTFSIISLWDSSVSKSILIPSSDSSTASSFAPLWNAVEMVDHKKVSACGDSQDRK